MPRRRLPTPVPGVKLEPLAAIRYNRELCNSESEDVPFSQYCSFSLPLDDGRGTQALSIGEYEHGDRGPGIQVLGLSFSPPLNSSFPDGADTPFSCLDWIMPGSAKHSIIK